MNQVVFLTFCSLLGLSKIKDYIYLFQIKEYRLDRFIASIHDNGFVQTFITPKKLPKKSVRNILITTISSFLLLFGIWSLFAYLGALWTGLYSVVIFPVIYVYIGVSITGVFAYIKKRHLMKQAALRLRESGATVIGITGSYGKTSAKEILFGILSQSYETAKTEGNMNTSTGVALSVLKNVTNNTRYFIAEMGAYKRGEIREICEMTHPKLGIITGIGNQHLDLFGSMDNLILAKKELLESLPSTGRAYVVADKSVQDRLSTGVNAQIVFLQNTDMPLNSTVCAHLAKDIGMSEAKIKKAIDAQSEKHNRYKPHPGHGGMMVIDNSYSTNHQGFLRTIHVLSKLPIKRKIIVTRGIIELGEEKKQTYQDISRQSLETGVEIYTTDHLFPVTNLTHFFSSDKELGGKLVAIANPDTVVAFEGRFEASVISHIKHI